MTLFKRILRTTTMLVAFSFVSIFAKAQSENKTAEDAKAATREAIHTSALQVVKTGKNYIQGNSSDATIKSISDEGVISFLNKTIDELEEKAERQYHNNRYVIIKED